VLTLFGQGNSINVSTCSPREQRQRHLKLRVRGDGATMLGGSAKAAPARC
jgi:hypothetical protein